MISDFIQRLLFVKEFDIGNGNTEVIGTKQMLVPLKFLIEMQHADPDQFYKYMNESVVAYIGRIEKEFGSETFKRMEEIFGMFGLGKLRVVDFDKENKKALVEVRDTPLLKDYTREYHVCSITTGVLAGMFTKLFDKEVHAIVNKCMAKGDDHCEFILK